MNKKYWNPFGFEPASSRSKIPFREGRFNIVWTTVINLRLDYLEKNLDGFCSWKGKALSLSHSFHNHYCLHLKEQIFCIVISLHKNSLPGKYVTSLITCFLSFLLLFPGRINFSYLLCFNWTCVEEQVISLEK